jgi:hypothetical protein
MSLVLIPFNNRMPENSFTRPDEIHTEDLTKGRSSVKNSNHGFYAQKVRQRFENLNIKYLENRTEQDYWNEVVDIEDQNLMVMG